MMGEDESMCSNAVDRTSKAEGGSSGALGEAKKTDDLGMISGDEGLYQRSERIIALARRAGLRLGTAESCTGGLVAGALTMVPGSSAVVAGGVVSYSNAVKQRVLGVEERVLASVGAVSSQTAQEMAEGARHVLDCDLAVSITGIAGPGGGSADKPVGTVYIGLAHANGVSARRYQFSGNRGAVRLQTVATALKLLDQCLTNYPRSEYRVS